MTSTPTRTPTRTPTATNTPTATPTSTPTLPWSLVPLKENVAVLPDGWRLWHVDLAFVNNSANFATPRIPLDGVQLRTTFNRTPTVQATYPVTAVVVSGAFSTRVKEFTLQSGIPVSYRVRGEYRNDRLMTFAFESQIPWEATPVAYQIAGYGSFAYKITPFSNAFGGLTTFKSGEPFTLTNQAVFTISNFTRDSNWHPAHDLIRANLNVKSINPTRNQTFHLNYVPITEEGILGSVYTASPDCRPQLTVGPDLSASSRLCAIVPKGSKKVKMIFTGDVNVVYDTQLK